MVDIPTKHLCTLVPVTPYLHQLPSVVQKFFFFVLFWKINIIFGDARTATSKGAILLQIGWADLKHILVGY